MSTVDGDTLVCETCQGTGWILGQSGAGEGQEPVPVRIIGDMEAPKRIKKVDPIYPEKAKKEGIEGVVILETTTDIYGRVVKVKILRSIPALNQAAVDAVKQWVYEPAIIDGKPRGVVFTVTVRFVSKKKKTAEKVAEKSEEGPVRAVGDIKPPTCIKKVDPIYPEEAREDGIEGTVILEATTDIYGRVQKVKVLESIPELDQAAIDAVKQWVYEPFLIKSKPIGVIFTVTIKFKLK